MAAIAESPKTFGFQSRGKLLGFPVCYGYSQQEDEFLSQIIRVLGSGQ